MLRDEARLPRVRAPVLAAILLAAPLAFAQSDPPAQEQREAVVPQAVLVPGSHRATEAEQKEIARLIERLAEVDSPDFGFAPTMTGHQFAPIPASRSFDGGILMQGHGLATNEAVTRLVALGPKAMPALLAALDDTTPTKYTVRHDSGMGTMWYGREVPTVRGNAREDAVRGEHAQLWPSGERSGLLREEHVREHVVTRGDVAFVVLGQIVGRGYQAVRYQPTACLVVNSPTHDPRIAQAVRALWVSDDPARLLFDSLLADYRQPPPTVQERPEAFDETRRYVDSAGAAMRLVYYFPPETRDFLAHEIGRIPVVPRWTSGGLEDPSLPTTDLIDALSFSDDPAIRAAIRGCVERAESPVHLLAALDERFARENPDLVVKKALAALRDAPLGLTGPYGNEGQVLQRVSEFLPSRARPLFDAFLEKDEAVRRRMVAFALKDQPAALPWAPAVLAPFLDDTTDTGWRYGPNYDRRPIRICDEVAQALAVHLPGASFVLEGDQADLDAQIAALKRQLAGEPPPPAKAAPEKVDLAALPALPLIATVELERPVGMLRVSSTRTKLAAFDGYKAKGWALDTVEVDAATGRITGRAKVDEWRGGVNLIPPASGERVLAYHGYEGGHVVVHDLREHREVARFATPFHDGVASGDPLQVRGLRDMALSGDGRWVFAATCDDALHAIEVSTGEHSVVWQRPAPEDPEEASRRARFSSMSLIPVEGTNRVLVDAFGGDDPLLRWDHDTRRMETLDKVEPSGWQRAAGDFAVNTMNGHFTLWDLAARKPVDLQGTAPAGGAVFADPAPLLFDFDMARARLVLVGDKEGYVFDLAARRPIARFTPPDRESLTAVLFSADGTALLCSAWAGRRKGPEERAMDPMRVTLFDLTGLRH